MQATYPDLAPSEAVGKRRAKNEVDVYKRQAQDSPLLLLPPTVPGSDCIASIMAVSYTHLDVYKRQGFGYVVPENSV